MSFRVKVFTRLRWRVGGREDTSERRVRGLPSAGPPHPEWRRVWCLVLLVWGHGRFRDWGCSLCDRPFRRLVRPECNQNRPKKFYKKSILQLLVFIFYF